MAKRIISGALFILLFLPALYFAYDRIDLIQNSTLHSATIGSCTYKNFSKSGTSGYRSRYTPVAFTDNRVRVTGTWYGSKKQCEKRLYREVLVFVHNEDRDKSRINSFIQLWLLPASAVLIPLLLLLGMAGKHTRGITIRVAQVIVGITAVAVVAIVWKDFYSAPKTSLVTDGSVASGSNELSTNVLHQCIAESIRKENVVDKTEIRKLNCQGSGITDLSNLEGLNSLEALYLQNNKLTSISSLPYLPNLTQLSIAANEIESLSGIGNAPNLEELQANKVNVSNIIGLEKLSKLRIVAFMFSEITDLSPLSQLQELEEVVFNYNNISTISALSNKPKLKKVHMYYNNISDISPLFDNRKLEILALIDKQNRIPCNQINYVREHNSIKMYEGWEEKCTGANEP